jgi:hypothetical protein
MSTPVAGSKSVSRTGPRSPSGGKQCIAHFRPAERNMTGRSCDGVPFAGGNDAGGTDGGLAVLAAVTGCRSGLRVVIGGPGWQRCPGGAATFWAAVPVQRLRGRPDSSCLHHRLHIRQRPASADEALRLGALMLNRVRLPSELSAYDEHDHRGGSNRFCHPAPPDARCQRRD